MGKLKRKISKNKISVALVIIGFIFTVYLDIIVLLLKNIFPWSSIIGIATISDRILFLTFLALLWYAWETQKIREYGGIEVETPIMYDIKHPSLASYLNRFPARQYIVKSEDKDLFLRFSACFGQFLMAKDIQLSYKHLPFKLYALPSAK